MSYKPANDNVNVYALDNNKIARLREKYQGHVCQVLSDTPGIIAVSFMSELCLDYNFSLTYLAASNIITVSGPRLETMIINTPEGAGIYWLYRLVKERRLQDLCAYLSESTKNKLCYFSPELALKDIKAEVSDEVEGSTKYDFPGNIPLEIVEDFEAEGKSFCCENEAFSFAYSIMGNKPSSYFGMILDLHCYVAALEELFTDQEMQYLLTLAANDEELVS